MLKFFYLMKAAVAIVNDDDEGIKEITSCMNDKSNTHALSVRKEDGDYMCEELPNLGYTMYIDSSG